MNHYKEAYEYPLRNAFILDSGATIHITNRLEHLQNVRPPTHGDSLLAGSERLWIRAYGTSMLRLKGPDGPTTPRLDEVAWCPDILTNLVSLRILRRQGMWWDNRKDPTTLWRSDETAVISLAEEHRQFVFPVITSHSVFSISKIRTSAVTAEIWHRRLGHPRPAVVEHLT